MSRDEFEAGLGFIAEFLFSLTSVMLMVAIASQLYRDYVKAYTELEIKIAEGKAFSSSKRFTLDAGASKQVVFVNESGREVKMAAGEVSTEGNLDIDIYTDVVIESHGSRWVSSNLNLGSSYTIEAYAEDGGTYSGGTKRHETIAYGGARNFAVGSLASIGEGIIIPNGKNIMLVLKNTTGSTVKVSVKFTYYER